jgi:FixJ family two-component response regulator
MRTSRDIVAVVDDDAAVLGSLEFLLDSMGFSVEIFSSADEFLARFRDRSAGFSCLVVDYNMPGLTGLDLVKRLRADGHSIPALLITAAPTPEISRIATEIGIEKMIAKPIPDDELLAFVRRAEGSR